jgi:hypothetical protein
MTDRIKSTDSAAALAVKVNSLMDSVDLLASAGGTFISSTPGTSDLLVFDSGWKNKTLTAGDVVFGSSTSNTFGLVISPTAFTSKSESTAPNFASDYLLIYDSGSNTVKKVKPNTLANASGATGQIQYTGSSGLLASLSSFSIDPATGKVSAASLVTTGSLGVGVSSPGYRVDALGDINASGVYRVGGTSVLTGTTLGSTIINSSLSSLGTLNALSVSGATSLASLTCPTVNGNVNFLGIISGRNDNIVTVSASTTVSSQLTYAVASNGITLTLPASPSIGDKIWFCPTSLSVNSWTVAYNGNSIVGLSENLVIDTFKSFALLWSGSTWLLV